MWARNAKNLLVLLRLDQGVQGVRPDFVAAIDSILLGAQWRATLNAAQMGRVAIYVRPRMRANICSLLIFSPNCRGFP